MYVAQELWGNGGYAGFVCNAVPNYTITNCVCNQPRPPNAELIIGHMRFIT